MSAESVDPRKFLIDRGIEHVKIGVFDTDGIMRGKYLNRENSSPDSIKTSGSAM